MNRVVVVGASVAGYRVVEGLRSGGFEGEIVLVGDEDLLPYDRPPLSKSVLTDDEVPNLDIESPDWYSANGVELKLGRAATGIDLGAKELLVGDERIGYDELVIATGARPRNPFPELPKGVFTLRSMDDALALRDGIRGAENVAVIGGGVIGLEVSSAVRSVGTKVTVIEAAEIPLARNLGPEAASKIGELARDAGVQLRCGVGVDRFLGGELLTGLVLSDGSTVDCDLAVLGIGALPNTEWLPAEALRVEPYGLICDQTGRAIDADGSIVDSVWAAGDVATWLNEAGAPERHEHWTSAHSQARIVAQNILDQGNKVIDAPSYVWSDQFGHRITIAGDTLRFDEVSVGGDGATDLAVLYAKDGKLVGACIVDQPRLAIQCRQWIALGTPVEQIEVWRKELESVS